MYQTDIVSLFDLGQGKKYFVLFYLLGDKINLLNAVK
jgi:hypothetical protein